MSSLDQSFEKNDFTQTLHERQVKRVYLMTYAQANLNEFPTCQVFSEKLLEFFSKDPNDNNPPTRWVCCQEIHTDRGKLSCCGSIQKLSQMVTNKEIYIAAIWSKPALFITRYRVCYCIHVYL